MSALDDLVDIARRSRNPREALRALVPPSLLGRKVLNDGPVQGSLPPREVAVAMRKLSNRLKGEALDLEEGAVKYQALGASDTFRELEETSRHLRTLDPDAFESDDDRLAFWVNLYNVLVIHGIVALEIRESVMEVPSFFGTVAYRIGRQTFTPDEVENGVLRRNGLHPAFKVRLFKKADPRLDWCVPRVDPRIHMALVCAAKSCPPISFYDPEQLDEQLTLAARNFVGNDVVVDDAARTITLSVIFKYYREDFGGPDGLRTYLLEHLEGEARDALRKAYDAGYRIRHHRYDWSLNSVL